MLGVLIMLHEFGHFIVARRNRVRVNEFAIGMGPKLFGWVSKRSGTLYSVRALPIGGYCAMEGEDGKSSEAEQQREFRAGDGDSGFTEGNFQSKAAWRRLVIVLAGPVANFILAFVILLVGALAFGVPSDKSVSAIVTQVMPKSPAALNGLQPGDRIVALHVNGKDVTNSGALIDTIHASLGKRLDVTYVRNSVPHSIVVSPEPCPANAHQGCIGFVPEPAFERVGFVEAVKDSGIEFYNIADNTFMSISLLVTHFTQYASQVSGTDRHGAGRDRRARLWLGPVFCARGNDFVRARLFQFATDSGARRRPRGVHHRRDAAWKTGRSGERSARPYCGLRGAYGADGARRIPRHRPDRLRQGSTVVHASFAS